MRDADCLAAPVTIHGETPVSVGEVAARERFGWTVDSFRIQCHSGRVREGRWGGPSVPRLLDAADAPPETTHLVIAARDGYRACVTLQDALDGLLALDCEERRVVQAPEDGEEGPDGEPPTLPRFLADVDPARTVQGVTAIDPVALGRAEDRSTYESF